jgi:hypothetical protein
LTQLDLKSATSPLRASLASAAITFSSFRTLTQLHPQRASGPREISQIVRPGNAGSRKARRGELRDRITVFRKVICPTKKQVPRPRSTKIYHNFYYERP